LLRVSRCALFQLCDDIDDGDGLGADVAVGGALALGGVADVGAVVGFSAVRPKPSFSRILPKNAITISLLLA